MNKLGLKIISNLGNVSHVQSLIDRGVDINADLIRQYDSEPIYTPLHTAIGRYSAFELFKIEYFDVELKTTIFPTFARLQ